MSFIPHFSSSQGLQKEKGNSQHSSALHTLRFPCNLSIVPSMQPPSPLPAPTPPRITAGFILSCVCVRHSPVFPASQSFLTFHVLLNPNMPHAHSVLPLHISLGSYKRQVPERTGAFCPWVPVGSLWPCWLLWVSELNSPLSTYIDSTAAVPAAYPVAGSAPFPKVSCAEDGQ